MTTRADLDAWIAAYERAWRSPGVGALSALFAEDATYRMSPYEEPATGLEAIAALWEREREGPDEAFEMSYEIVAVEGDTAVARIEVKYGTGTEYRDLWIVRFADDGRCREFEEWPFWPGRRFVAEEGERVRGRSASGPR
jgi:ketosteroid isomerase-like protein